MASTYNTKFALRQGGDYMEIGQDANGLPAILTSGVAASDVAIVAAIGADTNFADGSIYIEVKDGAGHIWQKQNDVWINLQV